MKSRWIIVLILVLALIVLCAGILAISWVAVGPSGIANIRIGPIGPVQVARVSAEATEQQSFTVKGQAMLDLTNTFGDIEIMAEGSQTGGDIQITALKTAWGTNQEAAEAALKDLKVSMTQDQDRVTIKVEESQQGELVNQSRPDSVDFTIHVPAGTTVLASTHSGDISLSGTRGKADLSTDFGDIQITDMQGGLSARSRSGKITARRIQLLESGDGDVSLISDFGDLILEDTNTQRVEITSRNGEISLTGVHSKGEVNLSTDFGGITFKSSNAGSLSANTRSGVVNLSQVSATGQVTAHSDFGDVKLVQVPAQAYDLSAGSGAVTVDGVQGSVKVRTDFGDITLNEGEKASLDVETRSGKISYRGSLGAGPHRLHTEFGSVRLSLPAETAFNFDLQTDFGKIHSDFKIQIDGEPDEKHWSGTVNGGGSSINASTRNGDISIETSGKLPTPTK